jgi:voltage-gated potassium channel
MRPNEHPMSQSKETSLRERWRQIIFEADNPAGRSFDVCLIVCIFLSVVEVMLASVKGFRADHDTALVIAEWFFTILFTVEYVARLWTVKSPGHYARSFFGVVDLLAILPTYLSLFLPGAEYFIIVRTLRVLRVFRVLKLVEYLREARTITQAMKASSKKIQVFLLAVAILVVIFGSLMYLIEGEANGFTSIPRGVYWAVVTLSTVGYGDVTPQTPLGQLLASLLMVTGYGIIAVPTGIVTAEFTRSYIHTSRRSCPNCSAEGHAEDARFCRRCGKPMPEPSVSD